LRLKLARNMPDWFYTYFPSNNFKTISILVNGNNTNYSVF
jgi:hypothetical protein